eukprot:scaffold25104_cov119-Isochrysis_galbana.AAC.6
MVGPRAREGARGTSLLPAASARAAPPQEAHKNKRQPRVEHSAGLWQRCARLLSECAHTAKQ